jgi:flagellar basal-body rod protein FlgB
MTLPGIDNMTSLLGTFLDVQSKRAEIVAGNLANADTPGYIAKELDFDSFLKNAARESLRPANSSSAPSITQTPQVVEQESLMMGVDGNTVDTAREMATLAEAGGKYMQGTQFLQMRFRTLRSAIREGK